jgi:uncharacterized protein (TIGR02600 family)
MNRVVLISAARRNISSISGMVLVMALAALAVMMILLLALFAGASHQVRGSQGDASLAREEMLADSAVALVIGQIQQASTQTNATWISQPGLLRIYSTNAVRTPAACYKLYSTASLTNMLDTSGNLNFFSTDVPANWSSEPSQYTDLNSPAQTTGGQSIYPILDPGALTNVEGVSSDISTNVTMPVAWLYELQDGTLGPASNGTAANPIVARIAFWTDDETCKININTAGCGSPWNTPRVNSTDDVAWSTTQPAAGEYSAYPGHPAMTSLAVVLGTNSYSPQQLLGLTPRYAWGGSQFGTQSTTPGEIVPAKMDRLYASLDELCFSTNTTGSPLQRQANPVSAAQLETARFVLTAHSEAPETTLLGEPRIAIWPVADSTSAGAPRITATDSAITNDATVGAGTTNTRSYFFQRNNPLNPTDDFNPAATNSAPTMSNLQLFNDLVNRGNLNLPGYGTTLSAKYPGAAWTQIVLEMADYIHGINAVDPSPAPFAPFAAGNSTNNLGYGFIDPLTTTYGTGTNQITLRGLGRCPTLSSLTLVFYVCGFGFKNGTYIDYEQTPDDSSGTSWKANFLPASTNWTNVVNERIRAFAVPSTFDPGCGYPEVSDECTVQIQGLNGITVNNGSNSGNLGFTNAAISHPLSDALKVLPADRAWGGNEGPLAWRAAALDAQQSGSFTYAFSGTNSFPITLASSPSYNAVTGALTWPNAKATALLLSGTVNLTVLIQDAQGHTLQTLLVNFPGNYGFPAPTPVAEYPQDGSGNIVYPSYYMTLRNRVLLTQLNREFLIQPGDVSRSIQAATDLRVIQGLANVPSSMFAGHPLYTSSAAPHAHNLRFADGTAVYGASGAACLMRSATYAASTNILSWTNWCNGAATNYALPISPPCGCPTTSANGFVTMAPVGQPASAYPPGDWDTGPGFSPDGAQINLPDSGTTNAPAAAYFSLTGGDVGAPTQRTPNALVPSPVIFGSLPAGINPATPTNSAPWRTLLFCPYPAADTAHPGFGNPAAVPPIAPDHLILDNFWMPVVEPYALSTCMATAGKINLNDQIAPFTYLHRNTAFHALLDDLRIPAISIATAATYKSPGTPSTSTFWYPVDENATIAQIENKFANNSVDAYLSESEICTVPLVPNVNPSLVVTGSVSGTQANLDSFWQGASFPDGELTGDNLRELPYAQLYGRLTTRSNSYTVHVRVQVLQKLPHDPNQNVWNEGVDLVLGDWRGSYEIERYLDPAATAPVAGSPLGPYDFRIVSSRRFTP